MPYSTFFPVTLSVLGPLNEGNSLALEDVTSPPVSGDTALVIVVHQVASDGTSTLLLPQPFYPGLEAVVDLPADGVYTLRGIRVQVDVQVQLSQAPVGEIRLDQEEGVLYQVVSTDPDTGYTIWKASDLDFRVMTAQLGPVIYYLHTTALTRAWNLLLLRVLHKELGPLPLINQPQVDHLIAFLGKLDRGLDGAKYLFQDQNYPEAARVVELLSLTRYL